LNIEFGHTRKKVVTMIIERLPHMSEHLSFLKAQPVPRSRWLWFVSASGSMSRSLASLSPVQMRGLQSGRWFGCQELSGLMTVLNVFSEKREHANDAD
jgi:hypothetical protein